MTRTVAALLLLAGPLAASPLDLTSPELIADGAEQFARSCSVGYCHGSEGKAARGPALRERSWDPRELYRITVEGLPGTSMPGWKGVIPDRSVWAVTAYVLSLSTEPPSGASAVIDLGAEAEASDRADLSPGAALGRDLFFDLQRERRCGVCHEVDGLGTPVGPNLVVAARSMNERELARHIVRPRASVAYGFEQLELRLRSGDRVAGVLAEETETHVRVFDAASVPPPLRSVRKRDIRERRNRERSSMPRGMNKVYSSSEIAKIVEFLRESGR